MTADILPNVGRVLLSCTSQRAISEKKARVAYDVVSTTRRIRDDHISRARLGIIRMQPFSIQCSDRNRHQAIGIPVEITLIIVRSSITRRKDVNAPFSPSTILYSIHHRLDDQSTRRFHRSTIIRRSPRTRINRVGLKTVVQSSCFIGVGNRSRENSDSCDTGFMSDSDSTDVVLEGGDLSSATSTVLIV